MQFPAVAAAVSVRAGGGAGTTPSATPGVGVGRATCGVTPREGAARPGASPWQQDLRETVPGVNFPGSEAWDGVGVCRCSRRGTAKVQRRADRTCGRCPSQLSVLQQSNKRSGGARAAFQDETEQQAQRRRTLNHLSAFSVSPERSNRDRINCQPRQPVQGGVQCCMCSSQNPQPLSDPQGEEPASVGRKPHGCAECSQSLPPAKDLSRRARIEPYAQPIPSQKWHPEMCSTSERRPTTVCTSSGDLERGSRGNSPERRPFTPGKALSRAHSLQTYMCFLPKYQEPGQGKDQVSNGAPVRKGDRGSDGGPDGVTDQGEGGAPGRVRERGADGGFNGMTDLDTDGMTDELAFGGPGRGSGQGADGGLDGMIDKGSDGGPEWEMDQTSGGGLRRGTDQGSDGGLEWETDQRLGGGLRRGMDRGADGGLEWEMDQRSDRGQRRRTDRGSDGEADGGVAHSGNRPKCVVALDKRQRRGERVLECADCGKAFPRLRALQDHQRVHTGERPFACLDCGKTFTRPSALRVHLQLHGGDRPYQCSLCGMKFAFGSRLRRHMRTHTGERPYACSECGVAFAQSSNLKDHQRSHAGEKPHECGQCGRAFVSSSTLVKHLRTHTGEKPYRCELCGKSFTQSSTLKRHKCPAALGRAGAGGSGHVRPADGPAVEEILCICECGKPYVKRGDSEPHRCPHTTQRDDRGKQVL